MNDRTYASNWREAKMRTLAGETGIRWTSWSEPLPYPIPSSIDVGNKVAGMMLGLAIGDALGNTSESQTPEARLRRYGWIEDYLPNRHAKNECIGLPSDDTQLSFWTLDRLIDDERLEPHHLAIKFCQSQIFGIGSSVKEFLRNFKSGTPWSRAGAASAGNGALMRIAPLLIPHLTKPSSELWGDVVLGAHLTHRDGLSTASCIGFVALLWEAIAMEKAPEGDWWLSRFCELVAPIEPEAPYATRGAPIEFNGRLTDLVTQHVIPAYLAKENVATACGRWYSGAYCLETVPSVLFILARFGHDPERAILEAVNNTKDNDTVAAIVGAAVGALFGVSGLRRSWIDNLSGRTTWDDDHQVFAILESAGKAFGFNLPEIITRRAALRSTPKLSPNAQGQKNDMLVPVGFDQVWVKIIGMLQQNWAGIHDAPDKAVIYFFDDHGGIFDQIEVKTALSAEQALLRNGFELFQPRHAEFLTQPGPSFSWSRHPNGNIYSSGRYWIPE